MLMNGDAYMAEADKYMEYLSVAKELPVVSIKPVFHFIYFLIRMSIQRSSCRNHRAVNAASSNNRRNLDATGVVACCCARHGCFIPTSVCDLQKGERWDTSLILKRLSPHACNRQVNVDYSVCNSLKFNTKGLPESLVIYDIMCQYLVNFDRRVGDLPKYLSLDPNRRF